MSLLLKPTSKTGDLNVGLTPNSASLGIKSVSASHTLAAAATSTETALIPAGVKLLFVVCRVTTAVVTSSATDTFDVGDAGDADRYGAGILGALGTTVDETDATADPAGAWSTGARDIIFDAAAAETFTAGVIRVTAFYLDPTPPSS